MSLKLKEENKIIPSLESLMEDTSIIYGKYLCWPLTLEGM